jgi:hypothetical protein
MSALCLLYIPKWKLVFTKETKELDDFTPSGVYATQNFSVMDGGSEIGGGGNGTAKPANANMNRFEPVYVKKSKSLVYMGVNTKVK